MRKCFHLKTLLKHCSSVFCVCTLHTLNAGRLGLTAAVLQKKMSLTPRAFSDIVAMLGEMSRIENRENNWKTEHGESN